MAVHEDLVIPQGKSWVGPTWALLAGLSSPYDLSGKTVRAQVRTWDRTEELYLWSTDDGNIAVFTGVTVDLGNGETVETTAIALKVTPAESAAWEWRTGVYDVEIADGDDVWPVVELSAVRIGPEVTR